MLSKHISRWQTIKYRESLNELDGPVPNPTPTLSISAENPYQQVEGDPGNITDFIFTVSRDGISQTKAPFNGRS